MRRFAWLSALATALTFPLIALGAVVRLKGAGLACPDWPLCYGRVTPLNEVVAPAPEGFKIALEVGHRYWAGAVGLLIIGLAAYAWWTLEDRPVVRWLSALSVALLLPQAVLGGLTVIMDLAPVTVSLHLLTGNLLFGALVLLTLQAFRDDESSTAPAAGGDARTPFDYLVVAGLVAAALQIFLGGWVSSTGASMACPEFPTCHGTWEIPTSGAALLQMGHRLAGFTVAGVLFWLAASAWRDETLDPTTRWTALAVAPGVVGQILLGWFNVAYYVPVPSSAAHTALAAALFGALAYLVGRRWLSRLESATMNSTDTTDEADPSTALAASLSDAWQTLLDYRELTKPRIVHLLVLTAFCTMIVAARGMPDWRLTLWTVVGTSLICGSAQVVNMVWDQDIDAVMERTSDRPIVQGRVDPMHALVFAGVLGMAGVMTLTAVHWLAGLMGILGHAYYSVVYTMWLKRATPQNIVIGGGAGAFPTLIGWTAVTGSLDWTALLVFAIVFLWTPPHFWALALYKETDYDAAGVPMMPVSRGERTTKFQMMLYTSLLIGASVLLGLVGMMGIVYLVAAILLGAGFAYCAVQTAFSEGDTWPKRTFAFSIVYLGLLFGAMSVDSLYTQHFTHERHMVAIEQRADAIRDDRSLADLRQLNGQQLGTSSTATERTEGTDGPEERERD